MKKLLIFSALLMRGFYPAAQQFQQIQKIDIPTNYTGANIQWLDMNHDGKMDIIVQAIDQNENQVYLIYKNETDLFSFVHTITTPFKNAVSIFSDVNMDGSVDIILSGNSNDNPQTSVLESDGNFYFHFLNEPVLPIKGSAIKFADLNQNGIKEFIISGINEDGPFLNIYESQQSSWVMVNDRLKVNANLIAVYDFNKDGVNDLFISGHLSDNTPYHAILINDRFMNFSEIISITDITHASCWLADINYDGIFDIVLAGIRNSGGVVLTITSTPSGEFIAEEKYILNFIPQSVFVADINSDGLIDYHVYGQDQTGSPVNQIFISNQDIEWISTNYVIHQQFGDFDYDGDLDLVQLTDSPSHSIIFYKNTTPTINTPPPAPQTAIAAILFGRLFLYWERPHDDMTPQRSLTFDIMVQTENQDLVTGNFDALNKRRLQVLHGNNGTNQFAFFRGMNPSGYVYHIQSIDNAYHAGDNTCSGVGSCLDIAEEELILCQNENKILSASTNALWFSFEKGFLGESVTYNYSSTASDTVFYLIIPQTNACAQIKIFIPVRKEIVIREYADLMTVCENEEINFTTTGNWTYINWSSFVHGFLSSEPTLTYRATTADTVTLYATSGEGCTEILRTAIKISKPVITLNAHTFHILKGKDVQLHASGGIRYKWKPPSGLNYDTLHNPLASPVTTTTYTVVVTDSIGCTDSAQVTIVVQQQAFIPTLFSPNMDGINDHLKIYGLGPVKKFSFTIMNREGAIVYRTTDTTEATQQGWDGSLKGILQPAGVYFWKVEGQFLNGDKLLLNGKDSGSIVLIR